MNTRVGMGGIKTNTLEGRVCACDDLECARENIDVHVEGLILVCPARHMLLPVLEMVPQELEQTTVASNVQRVDGARHHVVEVVDRIQDGLAMGTFGDISCVRLQRDGVDLDFTNNEVS